MLEEVRRPTVHRGLIAAIVALVVVLTGAAVAVGLSRSGDTELRGLLAARVTELLERSTPAEHHDHGHEFGDEAGQVVCAVDPFGYDPPDATTLAQVKHVYARHMCAITGPHAGWAVSVRASGPIAVDLGDRPVIRVPTPGTGYPERVRQLIPQRYQAEAFAEFADEDAIDAARARFSQAESR
jgi:hypothetical protein